MTTEGTRFICRHCQKPIWPNADGAVHGWEHVESGSVWCYTPAITAARP